MEIYKDYLGKIEKAMSGGLRGQVSNFNGLQKANDSIAFLNEAKETKPLTSLQNLASELGVSPNYENKLGEHPDFKGLKNTGNIEKHSILSMFIDIKGSTNLFKRYSPETVLIINNTIQRAAIHTCIIFGGYVQRLHGDGLFVYFGGKNQDETESIDRALTAASMFSYFVKNDLKKLFNEHGVETIFTRIGLDFGEADDVVWSMVGIGEISEITTCSLHTSLASKMQSVAESNGIVVGDNIKTKVDFDFFTSVTKRTNSENDRYAFQIPDEGFRYSQYDFDWIKFLKVKSFIVTDLNGNLQFKQKNTLSNQRILNNLKPIAIKNTPYFGQKNGES